MGVVYEALDRERNVRVALKRLRDVSGASLLQLKSEFRSLRDISHPNLVSLGELIEEEGRWFFTMELVEGTDFFSFVRPNFVGDEPTAPGRQEERGLAETVELPTAHARSLQVLRRPSGVPWLRPEQEARLRSGLLQLAEGLEAIHRAGKVHRDIKPSNLRVTSTSRVVLLDFGLVAAWTEQKPEKRDRVVIVGTPLYMAPEQVRGEAATPAADWYAVGMLMYQIILGRPPLQGRSEDVLAFKFLNDLEPLESFVEDIPEDLSTLCSALLERAPSLRPDGAAVIAHLRNPRPFGLLRRQGEARAPGLEGLFVGRQRELGTLMAMLAQSKESDGAAVVIVGDSGMGKTSLAQTFLERAAQVASPPLVLKGRCHERESVPFKAFDDAVDSLAQWLRTLPQSQALALIPRNIHALAQLFPVLHHVAGLAETGSPTEPVANPQELRSRAFGALRELLANVAQVKGLVLFADDLQWADTDSVALLQHVFRPPLPRGMLVVGAARPPPSELPEWPAIAAVGSELQWVRLGPLSTEASSELARLLLREQTSENDAALIATDAGGHPMFIRELVRHVTSGERRGLSGQQLDDALWTRIRKLDEPDLQLLSLVSVGGGPLANAVYAQASTLDAERYANAVQTLSEGQLLRCHGLRRADALEPYHDRIREAVLARLPAEDRRRMHLRLATALEGQPEADLESLATHWAGAGHAAAGAEYAEKAAALAEQMLAFGRAARLYRLSRKLEPVASVERRRELTLKIADALSNAAHNAEAAVEYLAAAENANGATLLRLKRLAAEKYMQSGHVTEGLPQLEESLRLAGLRLHHSGRKALLPLLYQRARVRLRGLHFRERPAHQTPDEVIEGIDAAYSASSALAFLNPVIASVYAGYFLRRSLDIGEASRVARALAAAYASEGVTHKFETPAAKTLKAQAEAQALRANDPHVLAYFHVHCANVAFVRDGALDVTLHHGLKAQELIRTECRAMGWETGTASLMVNGSYYRMGRLVEMRQSCLRQLQQALERDDFLAASYERSAALNLTWLISDDTAEAQRQLDESIRPFPNDQFHVVHLRDLVGRTNLDLYQGTALKAHQRIELQLGAWRRSLMGTVPILWFLMNQGRALAALAAAEESEGAQQRDLLRLAARLSRRVLKHQYPWSHCFGQLLEAGVAQLQGNPELALSHLREAETSFQQRGLGLMVPVARHSIGRVLGGDEGKRLIAEAEQFFSDQGVQRPDRMIAVHAAGFGV